MVHVCDSKYSAACTRSNVVRASLGKHCTLIASSSHNCAPWCKVDMCVDTTKVSTQHRDHHPASEVRKQVCHSTGRGVGGGHLLPITSQIGVLSVWVWSQLLPISHFGLKAQVYSVCDKIKLVGVLLKNSVIDTDQFVCRVCHAHLKQLRRTLKEKASGAWHAVSCEL